MAKVKVNDITMNYEQQGSGEPLILIPFLAADNACYAFQVAEYAKHFTCISIDPRGAGETDKPDSAYTIELMADDVSGLMQAIGVERAHISGLSLGGAIGMWLAAKYPEKVKSLSVHSGWSKSDVFLKTVVESWLLLLKGTGSVPELIINGIFPWCFTPELYVSKPDYIESLAGFVRTRPVQPVGAFQHQAEAVMAHDIESQLRNIKAPTQITFGRHDQVTSTRFAATMKENIRDSELFIFEDCSHAPIYENVAGFNQRTLEFLQRH
ncbi:MAG TPA: alpha/beta hydrolase [Pyrinomonadaceae bacterium]|nr:alpha/beta hydrolase [Pyrinomonadaceae bacterium]